MLCSKVTHDNQPLSSFQTLLHVQSLSICESIKNISIKIFSQFRNSSSNKRSLKTYMGWMFPCVLTREARGVQPTQSFLLTLRDECATLHYYSIERKACRCLSSCQGEDNPSVVSTPDEVGDQRGLLLLWDATIKSFLWLCATSVHKSRGQSWSECLNLPGSVLLTYMCHFQY